MAPVALLITMPPVGPWPTDQLTERLEAGPRADFEATLALVREVGFVDSFSFKFSPRPGTASASVPGTVSPEEAQDRLAELQALQRDLTFAFHRSRVGERVRILVEGPSRRGAARSGHEA